MVDNHEESGNLAPISKSFTVVKFLDQLPTYIRELHGVSQVSLSYLIRETSIPLLPLPPLRPDLPWSARSESIIDELIAFTPHHGPNYDADNARLFDLLQKALSDTASIGINHTFPKETKRSRSIPCPCDTKFRFKQIGRSCRIG